MCVQTFHPQSSSDFTVCSTGNSAARYSFNDKRLCTRHDQMIACLEQAGSVQLKRISPGRNEEIAFGRFLANEAVTLPELIHKNTRIKPARVQGRDILLVLDASSVNLMLNGQSRKEWKHLAGVINAQNTPGFLIMVCLVVDRHTQDCLGLGEVLFYSRPPAHRDAKKNQRARSKRHRLALENKETGSWLIAARNTMAQLATAASVTLVLDRGGDAYDLFGAFTEHLGVDFIVRSKYRRKATDLDSGQTGTLAQLLDARHWMDQRTAKIRSLDHFSKTSGKRIKRKGRKARLNIRYTHVEMNPPCSPSSHSTQSTKLWVVEVREDPSTVPPGESPIHWRLLTSRPIEHIEQAWAVVEDYRGRWHIEQLFRVLKKDGFDVEKSQLTHPDRIKKLLVMAIKASAEVMRLVNARDGEPPIAIDDVFDADQQKILHKLNEVYQGNTTKSSNPYCSKTLAYAVWIISRMGGWSGYLSQRPPGPKTIKRGLDRFYTACEYAKIFGGP